MAHFVKNWGCIVGVAVAVGGASCTEDSRCELTATCPPADGSSGVNPETEAARHSDESRGGEDQSALDNRSDASDGSPAAFSMLPILPPGTAVVSDAGNGRNPSETVTPEAGDTWQVDAGGVDGAPAPPGPSQIPSCSNDSGGCDPLAECQDGPTGATCGACPEGYAGDGSTGCAPALLKLEVSQGSIAPELDRGLDVYDIVVPVFIERITLGPEVPEGATVMIRGASVGSGMSWTSPRLALGLNEFVLTVEQAGQPRLTYTLRVTRGAETIAYLKASNTGANDLFGGAVELSADGLTLAVAAHREASDATGVGGDESSNTATLAGAVYVFARNGTSWAQQAYLKASNSDAGDEFGTSLGLSDDGNTLAVGASGEDSSATGTSGGGQNDGGATSSGAVYVFTRNGNGWSQQAYLKASNTRTGDFFGSAVAVAGDGNTLAVGAYGESSDTAGVGGDQTNEGASYAGAVYVFIRRGANWSQEEYIKASNMDVNDYFGWSVALSNSGDTLAVGAYREDGSTMGTTGSGLGSGDATASGAVYVFDREAGVWSQQAYLKASNAEAADYLGASVALSDDGGTLAVGAYGEDSSATTVDGDPADNDTAGAGAAYVFIRNGTEWFQQAYVKAPNAGASDYFGWSIGLSGDGDTLAVGAEREDGSAMGVSGDIGNNDAKDSGAVYVFSRSGADWLPQAYVKATNTDAVDGFGGAIALSGDGSTLAVGALSESSNAVGTTSTGPSNNDATSSGAVYVYR